MFVYQRVFLSWGKNVSWSEQVFDRNTFLPKNASENPTENKTKNLLCVETSIPEVLVLRRCSFDCPNPEESKLCRDGSIAWAHMDRIKTNQSIPEILHLPPVGPWQSVVFLPFELLVHPFSQWIGVRENLQENPNDLNGKIMENLWFPVSIFPTKPIHWFSSVFMFFIIPFSTWIVPCRYDLASHVHSIETKAWTHERRQAASFWTFWFWIGFGFGVPKKIGYF